MVIFGSKTQECHSGRSIAKLSARKGEVEVLFPQDTCFEAEGLPLGPGSPMRKNRRWISRDFEWETNIEVNKTCLFSLRKLMPCVFFQRMLPISTGTSPHYLYFIIVSHNQSSSNTINHNRTSSSPSSFSSCSASSPSSSFIIHHHSSSSPPSSSSSSSSS